MSNRRQLGMWITITAFVVAVVLMFAGVLFPAVGPPVPPMRSVTTQVGNTITTTVDVHRQPRTVRWAAVVPLGVVAVAGLVLMLAPQADRRGS